MIKFAARQTAVIYYSFWLLLLGSITSQMPDAEIEAMLQKITNKRIYDTKIRPGYLNEPITVYIDATVIAFSNIDAMGNTYTVDMFFRQRWYDERLHHDLDEPLVVIVGVQHPTDIVWVPDTVFINSAVSSMHHVTVNHHKLDIYPNGTVFWGTRVTVSPKCDLDLRAYPMDIQECQFKIVSYAYPVKHMNLRWFHDPGIKIDKKMMAQFEMTNFTTKLEIETYVAGNFSELVAIFRFKRLMGFAILQIYAPVSAIVCVSWISLWIRKSATPGRVALCITTLLTITSIWSSVNNTLPKVNYVKAIDVFLLTSFFCVVFTLLEYTIVLNCATILTVFKKTWKRRPRRKNSFEVEIEMNGRSMMDNLGNLRPQIPKKEKPSTSRGKDNGKKAIDPNKPTLDEIEALSDKIENSAKIFFPTFYCVFNIIYWAKYFQT